MSDVKIYKSCPYVKKCGACHIGDRTYEEELAQKKQQVETYIKKYCPVTDMVGMYYPYHYRNKVHAVFGRRSDKGREEVIAGTYAAGTHTIIPVKDCLIEDAQAAAIIQTVTGLTQSFGLWVYN